MTVQQVLDWLEERRAPEHDLAGMARYGIRTDNAYGVKLPELRGLRVPTVVIHGTKDKLVSPSGGRATAKAIPGARLVKIEGMGHDLPRGTWSRIIGAIAENAARAGEPAAV